MWQQLNTEIWSEQSHEPRVVSLHRVVSRSGKVLLTSIIAFVLVGSGPTGITIGRGSRCIRRIRQRRRRPCVGVEAVDEDRGRRTRNRRRDARTNLRSR
jgi:hypothetical protein